MRAGVVVGGEALEVPGLCEGPVVEVVGEFVGWAERAEERYSSGCEGEVEG